MLHRLLDEFPFRATYRFASLLDMVKQGLANASAKHPCVFDFALSKCPLYEFFFKLRVRNRSLLPFDSIKHALAYQVVTQAPRRCAGGPVVSLYCWGL